jgi:hypothetical protein
VINEDVLLRVNKQRNIIHEKRNGRRTCVEIAFYGGLLKERYKGEKSDRKTRKRM